MFLSSKSGIVNVYGSDATNSSSSLRPKPLKAIGNLTTSITSARFNHDSQLLAIASNTKKRPNASRASFFLSSSSFPHSMNTPSPTPCYSPSIDLLTPLYLQIHLPSMTAFSNWPTSSTPLGHVTAIDFSAGSEYVAVGNNRGRVLLYHLKDFGPS